MKTESYLTEQHINNQTIKFQDGDTTEIEPEGESHTTVDSAVLQEIDRDALMDNLDEVSNVEALLSDPSTELTPKIETAIRAQWHKIVGPDMEIVVRTRFDP